MKKIYGYARVSTREQNLDRQIKALLERGVDERDIVTDKASGQIFGARRLSNAEVQNAARWRCIGDQIIRSIESKQNSYQTGTGIF